MNYIFLFSLDASWCPAIVFIIFIILASDSDFAKGVLGFIAALIVVVLLGYFVITNGSPVCYWFAGSLFLLGVFQFLKYRSDLQDKKKSKDGKRSFRSLLAKGFRDALACISVGIAVVLITQIGLRTVFYFVSDDRVKFVEDTLYNFRIWLKGWLEYSVLLKTLIVLLILVIILPQARLIARYSKIRNWAERLFLVLVTVTSFTFFSAEGISAYRVEWTKARKGQAREAFEKRKNAQLKLMAMAYIDQEIRESTKRTKEDLKKLLIPPSPNPSPSSGNTKPSPNSPNNSSPPSVVVPSWNITITNPPKIYIASGEIKRLSPSDYGKYLGKEFVPAFASNESSTSIWIPSGGDEQAIKEKTENNADKIARRLQSDESPNPTLEELKTFEAETAKISARAIETENAFLEIFKNGVEELANVSDDNVLKPFVKALIESVSEFLVKAVFPKTLDSFEKAKQWVKAFREKNNQIKENTQKVSWRDKLSELFLSPKEVAVRAEQERKERERQEEIERKENEKLAEIRKREFENLSQQTPQPPASLTKVKTALVKWRYAVLRSEPKPNSAKLGVISKIEPIYLIMRDPVSSEWVQVYTVDKKVGWVKEVELIMADGSCICKFP